MAILFWISFALNVLIFVGARYVLKVHSSLWIIKYNALLDKYNELVYHSSKLSQYAQEFASGVLLSDVKNLPPKTDKDDLN